MRPSVILAAFLSALLVSSTSSAQGAPADVPPPAFAAPRLVRVELPHMDREGKLEVFDPRAGGDDGDDASWRLLCPSPCSVSVPVGTRLRVNGDFRESPAFVAYDRPTMRLAVDPARSGVRLTGILLAAGGGGIALLSGYVYASLPPDRGTSDNRNLTRGDMLGTGLVGAAVMGVGLGLAVWHWQTRVTVAGSEAYGVPIARGVWLSAGGVRF